MAVATMISMEMARAVVERRVRLLQPERKPVSSAVGYVLAEEVRADRDMPAADRSKMDGYAFAWQPSDTAPKKLRKVGEIPAGAPPPSRGLAAGECVQIFTGAALPPGADTVVMQERVERVGEWITLAVYPEQGANVLHKGSDARQGDSLVAAGTLLSPVHVGLCAAVGRSDVSVIARPRVAVLTTGNELRSVDDAVAPHEIRDSNRELVAAQLRAAGFEMAAALRSGDDEAEMATAVQQGLEAADVLLFIGGMSVGQYDYGPAVLRRIGAEILFHRLQVRPGQPQLFATLAERLVFGLPGNPLSVMVGLHELVLPALRRMSGWPELACRRVWRAPLEGPAEGLPDLTNYRLARWAWTSSGPRIHVLAPPRSSADLVSAVSADGFAILPPRARLGPGEVAEFLPWSMDR